MLNVIPWESLFGGILLGISATILLLVNGKIAGISGIMNGIMSPKKGDYSWRLLFAVGMIAGGLISVLMLGVAVPSTANLSLGMVIAAGLLVGIGTRLGNGCTSGHGICGIGRLSKRSIVATCVFMAVAGLTVFVRLHLV
ncbi:TPA: YeeE/YedE family protein [Vibrio parahaemolyticus]|uniref:YeeE/YedE family protein n=1 Tax=Vibrio parahaemolyticus TaxID=670 RepID=UPI000A3CBA40|nr:YeeE/YedE family protein [Vibrio parahaemolyticus]EGQ7780089.1 YeeE/YedE family protein [Vibrio parahaemolyticus]EGQ9920431.1 YeeE/YedE family protein [Vibrio parahaemolyticus]EJL3950018.1 YeeE/YedE family protein [Vibrio parahaemolyticus]MDF4359037.1 YeeE/YedE family protein [Vibrio parahaemolyticus]MDF4542204.1 YeeE/YedE family protein [Vibrio parahaemolyticus]